MLTVLSLLPVEVIVLVFILAAVGVVAGVVSRRVLGSILLLLIALPFIGAVAAAVLSLLPWWLVALIVVFSFLSFGRLLLDLLIGRRAAAHAVGHIVGEGLVGIFRLAGRLLLAPFR